MSDYKIKMHDIPENERPQERLLKYGPEYLSNAELLAIILRTGSKKENVVNMCTRILSEYNLKELSKADVSTLSKIYGVGTSKAAQIASIFELARKLETFVDEQKPEIKSPYDVYALLYPKTRGEKKEKFITLNLDTKNRVLKEDIISMGSLNSNIVHPREVFKSALIESSASVVITHNHPSGDPTPSKEDINITEKLVEGGKLLGIDILDHVILGDSGYISLKDEGLID